MTLSATQRQAAGVLLAAHWRASGADMKKALDVLDAGQRGDVTARRALAADCMRVAHALEAAGDPRAAVMLELAAEFDALAQ